MSTTIIVTNIMLLNRRWKNTSEILFRTERRGFFLIYLKANIQTRPKTLLFDARAKQVSYSEFAKNKNNNNNDSYNNARSQKFSYVKTSLWLPQSLWARKRAYAPANETS